MTVIGNGIDWLWIITHLLTAIALVIMILLIVRLIAHLLGLDKDKPEIEDKNDTKRDT
jgi:hypothetical protein